MEKEITGYDLFGNPIMKDVILREKFVEPPFTVLDSKSGNWQKRKNSWKRLGIKSELGRDATVIHMDSQAKEKNSADYTSIFDPALCEVCYKWFCDEGGWVLDPFAGGSVRGIVAAWLGYNYCGIDIRKEQVESNEEQAAELLKGKSGSAVWACGDSNEVLDQVERTGFDMVFSCPPYGNLERYSDLEGDISNMEYPAFLEAYRSIVAKSCARLKVGGLACFVVGDFRDKDGGYVGFVPDTVRAFVDCGMQYYNEAIYLTPIASASMRADGNMKSRKLVKVHQNVLVFKKVK